MGDYHLVITTWCGVTAWARHYYGRIKPDDYEGETFEVDRPVTSEDIASGDSHEWAGRTIRFTDKDALIRAAVERWADVGIDGTLYLGSPIYDDREVLAAANAITEEPTEDGTDG